MSKIKKICLMIVLLSPYIYGQQKWSLENCINYALENNISLKQNSLNIQASEIIAHQAKLNYIPDLGFQTRYQLSMGRSLDPTTYEFIDNEYINSVNMGFNLNFIIFNGFKRHKSIKKHAIDLDISKYEHLIHEDNIALNITNLYFNILLNKEIIKSIKAQLNISNADIEKMRRLVKEGRAADEHLQNLLMQQQNEVYSFSEAKASLQKAIIALCSILNIQAYEEFEQIECNSGLEEEFPLTLEEIISSAMTLPQIEVINRNISSNLYEIKIAKADLYPTLSFSSSYSSSYSSARRQPLLNNQGQTIIENGSILYSSYPFCSQIDDNRTGFIGLNLSIPILSSFNRRSNIKLSQINNKRLEYELNNTKKTIIEEIQKVYVDVELSKKKYLSALAAANHGKKIIEYSKNKFENGLVTMTDYIIAKNNVLVHETLVSRAKYEYLLMQKILKYYYNHTIK